MVDEKISHLCTKISFRIKLLVSLIVVILQTIMRFSISIEIIKYFFYIWAIMASILILLLIPDAIGYLKKIFFPSFLAHGSSQKINQKSIPSIYEDLALKMGVIIPNFRYVKNFENAVFNCIQNELLIGNVFEEMLAEDERIAIIAHELAHKKNFYRQLFISILGAIVVILYGYSIILGFSLIRMVINIIALIYLIMFLFLWLQEFDSDITAAKYVEKDSLINALLKISKNNLDESSFTHPSIRRRISILNKIRSS